MPTIVDELVTIMKLDTSDFTRKRREIDSQLDTLKRASVTTAQRIKDSGHDASTAFGSDWQQRIVKVEDSLKRVGEQSRRTGISMKSSGQEAAEFFTNIKTEALGLIGVLVGATGLTSVLRNSAEAARSLKQEAQNINIDPQRLSGISLALERHGGSAESTRGSLFGISQALERRRLLGDPAILPYLSQIGATADQTPDQILGKFIEYAQKNKGNGPQVNLIGHGLGLDQGTVNAALSFKSVGEFQKDYNDALRDSPTKQEIDNLDSLQKKFIEFEQTLKKFGTDYASGHSDALGHVLDEAKDFIRENPKLLEGLTDLTTAMLALRAASVSASILGLTDIAAALSKINGLVGSIVRFAPWLLATGPAGGEDPKFSAQKNQEFLKNNNPANNPISNWLRWHLPSALTGGSQPIANSSLASDPTAASFLTALSDPESGGRYNIKNGGALFSDYSQFPDYVGDGGTSTASGRYQITRDTWADEQGRLGLRDFSPANQDKAAWDLASRVYRDKTGRDLSTDWKAGGHEDQIAAALHDRWPTINAQRLSQSRAALNGKPSRVSPATGATPIIPAAPNVMNPMLFPGAYQQPAGGADNSRSITVGHVTIQTAATDANGIARDFAQALVVQANRGLA